MTETDDLDDSQVADFNFPDFDPDTGLLIQPTTDDSNPDEGAAERQRLKDLELENERLRRQAEVRPPEPIYSAPAQPTQAIDINDLNTRLAGELLANPTQFLNAFKQQIKNEVLAEQLPAKYSSVKKAVNDFVRSQSSDPLFDQAKPYFDEMISKIKPNDVKDIPFEAVEEQVENIYNLAVGRSIRSGNRHVTRDSDPPLLSSGSSVGAAKTVGKRGPMTREEKDMISAARDMGLADADIAKMLANVRKG